MKMFCKRFPKNHKIPELRIRTCRFLYVLYASNLRTGVNEHIHLQTCNLISLFYFGCRWFSVYSYFVGGKVQQGYTHTHMDSHTHTLTQTHRQTHIEGPQKTFVTISHVNTSCQERLSHTHTYAKHNYNCHNTKAAENLVPSVKSSTN